MWAKRTAEEEFTRTNDEPSPDAPPDAQPPPGKLRSGLRRAWFCQLQERCRELIATRTGVPRQSPPLMCLSREGARDVAQDDCRTPAELEAKRPKVACYGPHASKVRQPPG